MIISCPLDQVAFGVHMCLPHWYRVGQKTVLYATINTGYKNYYGSVACRCPFQLRVPSMLGVQLPQVYFFSLTGPTQAPNFLPDLAPLAFVMCTRWDSVGRKSDRFHVVFHCSPGAALPGRFQRNGVMWCIRWIASLRCKHILSQIQNRYPLQCIYQLSHFISIFRF